MKQICPPKLCTGCGACANVCPKQCISMDCDKYGFLHPNIDKSQCVDCRLCEKTCPNNREERKEMPLKAIVACSKNDETVRLSSSGGIFSELAKSVFDGNGVVFGAVFADDFLTVHHSKATNLDELSKMRGSKYIQSNILGVYKESKSYLQSGKKVLFSGTPCQVAGLKSYLGKDYPNLLTVDFVCHGVAPSKAYREYLKSLNLQGKICDVQFRYKKTAADKYKDCLLRICLEDGTCFEEKWLSSSSSSYCYGFVNNLLLRTSCIKCKYANVLRVSDITLGDYLADVDSELLKKSPKAKSLVLINTEAGAQELSKITDSLLYSEISIEKAVAVSKNLQAPTVPHRNRKKVMKYVGKRPWNELTANYFTVYKPVRTLKSIKNKLNIFK